jgi:transposase
MPWKEMSPVNQRVMFVADHAAGLYLLSELAERYGISRKTAYKWLERFKRDGPGGLEDRASVADDVWNRTSELVEAAIVASRKRHADWGPKKLIDLLQRRSPGVAWPAISTVAAILKRHGLVEGQKLHSHRNSCFRSNCSSERCSSHPVIGR